MSVKEWVTGQYSPLKNKIFHFVLVFGQVASIRSALAASP